MSTTTPEKSPPDPVPVTAPVPLGAPLSGLRVETAPSAMLTEGMASARLVGFIGLVLLVLGGAAVIAHRALPMVVSNPGPRMVSEGMGFMFAALGLAFMLYHATTGDPEYRRIYGGFALFWILFGVVAAMLPGPLGSAATGEKAVGYYLMPWSIGAMLIGLLFTIPFCRHETDEFYRTPAITTLVGVGGLLSVGSVAAGIFRPESLAGPGLALAVLGLAFLCAYLGQVDVADGVGFTVAFALGAFGAGVVCFAIAKAAFPTLLFEGPNVLRLPNGSLDIWKASFRVLGGIAFLVPFILALATRSAHWLKLATGIGGLIGAGVVAVSLFTNPIHTPPRPFLVPSGLILMSVGLLYLTVSLGACSDNQFVTLTRRELATYFLSPIGYLVLGGMIAIAWLNYQLFVSRLASGADGRGITLQPIVRHLFFALLPVISILLMIPALTMRLVSEERRTGSLEVLLTAPVNEGPVVLSKFLATWIFFLICWLPWGLYLIALRNEIDQSFDYLPLLSFYVCLAAQGIAFVGMGVFFSTVTRNQVVAAVLTFVGVLVFLACFLIRNDELALGLPPFLRTALGRLSFVDMWHEALSGRLPLRDVLLFSTIGAFWLFLSVKVLEARKWS